MTHKRRSSLSLTMAAAAAVGLVGSATTLAIGAPHVRGAVAATPELKVTISKTKMNVAGPKSFAAGRVALSLKAVGDEREVEVVSFNKGYSFEKLDADLAAFGKSEGKNGPTKAGLKHLNAAVKGTTLYGGLDTTPGSPESGTVVLPKAGTYTVYNDSGDVPADPTTLTVSGPAVTRATPKSTATVIATTAKRFSGAATLPANGTITFKNASTNSPHFLSMFQVKPGTTRKQVIEYFNSGSQKAPSFALRGSANTEVVGTGRTQTLTYDVPKGSYVEACFFPDLKTGMPHALMGMVRIVTLK